MKRIILFVSVLVFASCDDSAYKPKSICDNTLPEGIVVDFDDVRNQDEYVMSVRSKDGLKRVIVANEVRKYVNRKDTITHCN